MRRELGVPTGTDVLAHAASLPTEERIAAELLIKRIEDEAMLSIELQPGLDELITYLESIPLPKAILTRNNPDTVAHFLSLREPSHQFEILVTREFQPPKPAPDPLLHIAKTWNIQPDELMMVGIIWTIYNVLEMPVLSVSCLTTRVIARSFHWLITLLIVLTILSICYAMDSKWSESIQN
ncbi:hypothetical protein BDF22DRAFT_680172, partial [Syncephalis plumigaleata]